VTSARSRVFRCLAASYLYFMHTYTCIRTYVHNTEGMGTHDTSVDAYVRLHVAELKARLLKHQREHTSVEKADKNEEHYNQTSASHIRMTSDTEENEEAEAARPCTMSNQATVTTSNEKRNRDSDSGRSVEAAGLSTFSVSRKAAAGNKGNSSTPDFQQSDDAQVASRSSLSSKLSLSNKKRSKTSDSEQNDESDVVGTLSAVSKETCGQLVDLFELTQQQLRDECRKRGLPVYGSRQGVYMCVYI
jgi:hypothetical protein